MRLGLIDFARLIKDQVASKMKDLGVKTDFVDKEVGYELRCADPVPFDAEYTRTRLRGREVLAVGGVSELWSHRKRRRREDEAAALHRDAG